MALEFLDDALRGLTCVHAGDDMPLARNMRKVQADFRVARGGGAYDIRANRRSAARIGNIPLTAAADIGLRVVGEVY